MDSRIKNIIEHWFLSEPPLFQVACTHSIEENTSMNCPVRSGQRRIEYNPLYTNQMTQTGLEEALRAEAVRILLKHPYERKPEGCSQQAISVGSNLVIGDNYNNDRLRIEHPIEYDLPQGRSYEWYSRRIQNMLPNEGQSPDSQTPQFGSKARIREELTQNAERNRDLSELWDEDDMTLALIDGIIEGCKEWGSLAGSFAEMIKASVKAKINWRNIFSGFRASILSSRRKLTRMRPNRRTGYENMGSIRQFNTRLLVAVDVSGSISSENLSHFYGVINSAFKYGFEAVDVIQFDHGIRTVQNLKHKLQNVVAVGRGGTSFQEPIDYANANGYDGVMILTDGYAARPSIPNGMRCKIIWVCTDRDSYRINHVWMAEMGRVCMMDLSN